MDKNYYYIPSLHKLIYCHEIVFKDYLILGGNANYLDDSKTNSLRQGVEVDYFLKFNPITIDIKYIDKYPFLTLCNITKSWRINSSYLYNEERYLPSADQFYKRKLK